MKHFRLFLLAILGLALSACQSLPGQGARATIGRTSVVVDPRIELMSVVQLLSRYPLVTSHNHSYKAEAARFFAPHARHRAVTMFATMRRADFNFSAVPEAVMAFTPPPALRRRRESTPAILASAGGEAQLDAFVAALRDFAAESRFEAFYRDHAPVYAALVSRTEPVVSSVLESLRAYTGIPLGDTTVVLGPLLHDGGFAATYRNEAGRPEVYAFIGPVGVVDGVPDFGTVERLDPLITHEFAHSIMNPLVARHRPAVAARAQLHAPIREAMLRQGYGEWDQVVYEHVIRAITVRLTTIRRGEAAGQAALQEELNRGFSHLPALLRRLEQYERSRNRYPTIADFFPELLTAFA